MTVVICYKFEANAIKGCRFSWRTANGFQPHRRRIRIRVVCRQFEKTAF